MEEDKVTKVLSATEKVPSEPGAGDGGGAGDAAQARAKVPRRWFAAAVVAVMLVAGGVGVLLGMQGEKEPKKVVVAEAETEAEAVQVTVPDLRGMTLDRATADAQAAGLAIGATATAVIDPSVTTAGTVLSQDPLPGADVPPGTEIALVIAEAPAAAQPPADTSGSSSGASGATGDPPPAPEDVTVEDIGKLTLKPQAINLGLIQTQQWTSVIDRSDTALQWQSPTVTFGGGEKRILMTADGPSGYLIAVWSWDAASDTDWKLESIVVSAPGGASFETALDAPAGNHTFLVKSGNAAVLWKLKVQEKK